ncbi:MAG: homocysteine S-methyltransferase family protein [Spongiibacteraceae bacterium]
MSTITDTRRNSTFNRGKWRHALPQLQNRLFATDGGLETTLIFQDGIDLPAFAAFDLLKNAEGTARLQKYYAQYADLARRHGLGMVLEAPTWRANRDWGTLLGYDQQTLEQANRNAVTLMENIRAEFETPDAPMVISGNLGPRGDGYIAAHKMSADESENYHREQIDIFATTAADMVAAFTMNYVEEAIGIVRAAKAAAMPVVISFTLETDGRLPSGQTLRDAILETDATSGNYPAYYMINCAHPAHFQHVLSGSAPDGRKWQDRIRGLRANASCKSHAELDASTELDAGNPAELGQQYRALTASLRQIAVIGGCCGTDHRHVEAICREFSHRDASGERIAV